MEDNKCLNLVSAKLAAYFPHHLISRNVATLIQVNAGELLSDNLQQTRTFMVIGYG